MMALVPPPEVSVVIGTYNRLRYLKATLESVRDELAATPHEIIVIDGGSTDGTPGWLAGQKDVVTIIQHNRGEWRGRPIPRRSWGYFMNLGFKCAQGELVCMLSDDCLVIDGAIRNGIETFRQHTASGEPVGAVAFYWRNWPSETSYRVGLTWGGRLFVNHGLYSRAALERVGYVDEETFGFYHADGDLALRMDAEGLPCIASEASFVEHYADANLLVRRGNLAGQQKDWRAYAQRWEYLGAPDPEWLRSDHADPNDTVHRYWGRLVTHPAYRLGMKVVSTSSVLFGRMRGRG